MDESGEGEISTTINVDAVPETEVGRFADFARVWHTDDVFVLDFAALKSPIENRRDGDGRLHRHIDGSVVSRVRIAPAQVFELAKALTRELESWERATGRPSPQSPHD